METLGDVTRLRRVGGNLALDFVNTRTGPPVGAPDGDVLTAYPGLVAWARYADVLTEAEAAALRRLARDDPSGTRVAFERSLHVRDYLDEIFRRLAAGRDPDPTVLARLRDDEADALGHAQLDRAGVYAWSWRDDRTPARPLRPVVHAAVQLLTSGALDRIKGCEGCRFLFHDESKNRSRRWCSMDDCGTAEKMRRYVAARRTRAAR
ncbi:CGNR zinc finger domain-containing protein [Jidongwangia harbinensis]|uniref:CGNR zinc finger domain-containing protein n=1 Tax=Jidongwangia harbinensis TaxID=2878561 RepID=UPI001CD9ECA1|nr:ABATE domain-containing protein [Jidongwangia harbinensis]MCA2211750.1 CGNR zinc finger domain-containing protein [Jidongwangia harbinensis]